MTNFDAKMRRFFETISRVIILSATVLMVYVGYLLWWPMEAVKYDSILLEIATTHLPSDCAKTKDGLYIFHPGDIVPIRTSGVKYIDIPAQIMPRLIDSSVTLLPDYTARRGLGRFDEVSLTHKLPRNVSTGIHYFEFNMTYEVNPLRTLKYQTRSVPFWVEPRKDPSCMTCKYKRKNDE